MDPKLYCVYILASHRNGVLYVGASSRLVQRVWQHKVGAVPGFTSRYRVHQLVWFEVHGDAASMVARERRIKAWKRAWKVQLIESMNPRWDDLNGILLRGGALPATPSPAPDPP